MLQAILFDLDGTLLPMDNDYFVQEYFKLLARCSYTWGYTDTKKTMDSIWEGVAAMVKNDGSLSNYEVFWNCFAGIFGDKVWEDVSKFNAFYLNEFNGAASATFPTDLAPKAVRIAREKAQHVILATNPIFPMEADISRMAWTGLKMEDFDLVTDYKNSCHSKPNPAYYRDILEQFDLRADQCLMVGNDANEDMAAAAKVGMPCFLIDDFLINRLQLEITCPHGSFADMVEYLETL